MPQLEPHPFILAGRSVRSARTLPVLDKFTGDSAGSICLASPQDVETAIAATVRAAPAMRAMPAHARATVLSRVEAKITADAEALTRLIVIDSGKPIRDARAEVGRAAATFRVAAEEATRIGGVFAGLDTSPRSEGYQSIARRFPVGPCSFITPFNFPLNLVAHKVAPAIAAGCPFVLKPSDKAPLSALKLGEYLAEAGLPEGAFSILPAMVEDARGLVTDERLKLLSFTGSAKVGWGLKTACGEKKIVLELGGDAAAVIAPDADLDHAVKRLILGAFSNSGQSCISVQRIIAHESVVGALRERLVAATKGLAFGDPGREETVVGPMITPGDAERLERWVAHAVRKGAKLLCGGTRSGSVYAPTLVENVPEGVELSCEEAFGPIACISSYRTFDEAISKVNASRFGIHAGLFTRDLGSALAAWERLEVAGVIINDVPTFRTESMPYGGIKESGLGREGVRSSILEMTEERLLVVNSGASGPRA